jgi:O-antigen/teichoic acid export membrane protein
MKKGTPAYVYITVYIGWILGFVIFAILPLDLYTSSVFDEQNPGPNEEFYRDFLEWNWKILYMITFILTWLVFPFLMVYVVRGEFTFWRRLKKTCLENLISYVVYTVAVVVFLLIIYFLVNKDRKHKDKVGIFDVVYVLSTVYGLLLIVFLMSYGMVAVPKFFWSKSNYKSRIKKQ